MSTDENDGRFVAFEFIFSCITSQSPPWWSVLKMFEERKRAFVVENDASICFCIQLVKLLVEVRISPVV